MSFNSAHFLQVAEELTVQALALHRPAQADLREAKLRSAISRAYYAAFWCARHYWANANDPLPLGDAHYEAHERFLRYASQNVKQIGLTLRRLKEARNLADYASSVPDLEASTHSALRWANRLIGDIASLPDDPTQAP